ncbi:MAG: DEAD/DEAH box helicase [Saprospiraceae bacterium]|nr:DEAD/DEAH box helicase [Saprospiraceae bacterium]
MSFTDLHLIEPLLIALEKNKYTIPSPIQMQCIPHILNGKDIFGCAQTGTGKTAAFALPILQLLESKKNPEVARKVKTLVLAPTRELASQISDKFREYGKNLTFRHTVIFGGVSQTKQVAALTRGIDIVIATPGRLLDLMQQGIVNLDAVEYLVLDEADRMLDMGFIHDVKKILAKLPVKKQTMFFTATSPANITKLAATILKNPIHVNADPISSAPRKVSQKLYYVQRPNKTALLTHILKSGHVPHVLVFTRTKRGADRVAKQLNSIRIKAEAIHGNKSQGQRERALQGFKDKSIGVLVATDIASRGIDISKLSHVINYDLPEVAETYVHRIGRTGRAGESGEAISFCCAEETEYLRDIQKLTGNKMEIISKHPFA